MSKFFSLTKGKKAQRFDNLKRTHQEWKEQNFESNKPFFPIHSDFLNLFLKDISGPALKLYVFLGLHAKYHSGESWYSLPELSEFFRKDPRTVANWAKELEDLGLIVREQKGFKMKATTFLRPYGYNIEINKDLGIDSSSNIRQFIAQVISSHYLIHQILILDYQFYEFSIVVIYKEDQDSILFESMCFLNVEEDVVLEIKKYSRKMEFPIDSIDVPIQLSTNKNKSYSIVYSAITKYFNESLAEEEDYNS